MAERAYSKLIAWQAAHRLCLWVYGITNNFPAHERFALGQQMRRAAYSVPTNIAEGNIRRTRKDKSHFMVIALGSLEEVHYQCRLAYDLQYIDEHAFKYVDEEVHRVSYLITKLKSSLTFNP